MDLLSHYYRKLRFVSCGCSLVDVAPVVYCVIKAESGHRNQGQVCLTRPSFSHTWRDLRALDDPSAATSTMCTLFSTVISRVAPMEQHWPSCETHTLVVRFVCEGLNLWRPWRIKRRPMLTTCSPYIADTLVPLAGRWEGHAELACRDRA